MAGVSQFDCVLIVFSLILKITLDLNIWWSVTQFAPSIVRVLQMSILSRHLVMMKSIIYPCRERGCVQVVLCASCLNMVLVTMSSNSVHSANRSSPLESHFPIPYLPKAEGHLSFSLLILVLKSPISRRLSVLGMSILYLASYIAISDVRLSGLSVVYLSSSVLTFHWTIVIWWCFLPS